MRAKRRARHQQKSLSIPLPHMDVVRDKLAVLHRAYNSVTTTANCHRPVGRDLGTAKRQGRQRHEVGEAEDHVQECHRFGHLILEGRAGRLGEGGGGGEREGGAGFRRGMLVSRHR